jgi:hypothetical protein
MDESFPHPNQAQVMKTRTARKIEFESRSVISSRFHPGYRFYQEQVTCTCHNPEDLNCLRKLEEIARKIDNPQVRTSCPSQNNQIESNVADSAQATGMFFKDDKLIFVSPPKVSSMLSPNHFHKILEGNCPGGKSANYQLCAAWAYKSPPCNAPRECNNDSFYLGINK